MVYKLGLGLTYRLRVIIDSEVPIDTNTNRPLCALITNDRGSTTIVIERLVKNDTNHKITTVKPETLHDGLIKKDGYIEIEFSLPEIASYVIQVGYIGDITIPTDNDLTYAQLYDIYMTQIADKKFKELKTIYAEVPDIHSVDVIVHNDKITITDVQRNGIVGL